MYSSTKTIILLKSDGTNYHHWALAAKDDRPHVLESASSH